MFAHATDDVSSSVREGERGRESERWQQIVAELGPKMPPHIAHNFLGDRGQCAREIRQAPNGSLIVVCWNATTARILTRYAQGMPVRFTALVPTSGQEG